MGVDGFAWVVVKDTNDGRFEFSLSLCVWETDA